MKELIIFVLIMCINNVAVEFITLNGAWKGTILCGKI